MLYSLFLSGRFLNRGRHVGITPSLLAIVTLRLINGIPASRDPLNLIRRDGIIAAVLQPGRLNRLVSGYLLGFLSSPPFCI